MFVVTSATFSPPVTTSAPMTLAGHEGRVWAVAWAAAAVVSTATADTAEADTEQRLLTAGQDGQLAILAAEQGTHLCVHNLHQPVRCVSLLRCCCLTVLSKSHIILSFTGLICAVPMNLTIHIITSLSIFYHYLHAYSSCELFNCMSSLLVFALKLPLLM